MFLKKISDTEKHKRYKMWHGDFPQKKEKKKERRVGFILFYFFYGREKSRLMSGNDKGDYESYKKKV